MSNFISMITALPSNVGTSSKDNYKAAIQYHSGYMFVLNSLVNLFEKLKLDIKTVDPVIFAGANPFPSNTLSTTFIVQCDPIVARPALEKEFGKQKKLILDKYQLGSSIVDQGNNWLKIGVIVIEKY